MANPILSVQAGSYDTFAIKLKQGSDVDSLSGLRQRIGKKLDLAPQDVETLSIKYEWVGVYYALEDADDWDIFKERINSGEDKEIRLSVTGEALPAPEYSKPYGHTPLDHSHHNGDDAKSFRSAISRASTGYDSGKYTKPGKAHSVHLIASSERDGSNASRPRSITEKSDGASTMKKSRSQLNDAASMHTDFSLHKQAFEDFQNTRGVRTFVGSIGPVENVRMMMKSGHRACYMSREFAQQHEFIPKDAAPGFYGFSGITNLGTWPIKVGEKTVNQQVMLVESAFFPIVLGRSFMEKRGVRTDPLDQTYVTFMDTGEVVPTDLVVVKDVNGSAIPIP